METGVGEEDQWFSENFAAHHLIFNFRENLKCKGFGGFKALYNGGNVKGTIEGNSLDLSRSQVCKT